MANSIANEPAALAAHGWDFYEKCRCNGILKYKYHNAAHAGLELEWWPKYYQFRITYNGRQTKVPPTPIANLEHTLTEL